MVMAPEPLPGPPGIETLEMPFQPHELSTIATAKSTSPCQARCRISPITPLTGCRFGLLLTAARFGLLLARVALVALLTGHLRSQQPTPGHPRSARARPPAPV